MWLLIVATSMFAHSSVDPVVYAFQEFPTEARCQAIKQWIDDKKNDHVQTQCVRNG